MTVGVSLVVGALSTGNKIGLAVVGGAFIVFALVSSFLLPSRYPDFPGRYVGWYVAAGILFFLAMIAAVLVFGRESKATNEAGGTPQEQTTTAASSPTTTSGAGGGGGGGATQGDPAKGKALFTQQGCNGCHTLKAAGANGTVGPNLDRLKPSFEAVVHQVENGGGAMPSFKGSMSEEQIHDVAAFVVASTS